MTFEAREIIACHRPIVTPSGAFARMASSILTRHAKHLLGTGFIITDFRGSMHIIYSCFKINPTIHKTCKIIKYPRMIQYDVTDLLLINSIVSTQFNFLTQLLLSLSLLIH